MKSHPIESRVERIDSAIGGMHLIPVPAGVVAKMPGVRRVLIEIDGREFSRALQGLDSESPFLMMGLQFLKELGLRFGSKLHATIRPDPRPDDPDIAAELLEALDCDDEARARWDTFTPGKRRSLNHHVATAKRCETRERRAVELVQKIREHRLYGDACTLDISSTSAARIFGSASTSRKLERAGQVS